MRRASSSATLPARLLMRKPQSVGESIALMGKQHSPRWGSRDARECRNHAEAVARDRDEPRPAVPETRESPRRRTGEFATPLVHF